MVAALRTILYRLGWPVRVIVLLAICSPAGYSMNQASGGAGRHADTADCRTGITVTYAPAEPSQKFIDLYGETGIAITSFRAACSRLQEASVWLHEASSGLIAAQLSKGSPYGPVIATGAVSGRSAGKQRIDFSGRIFLEEGEIYYLKIFKGEPATVSGSVARAAQNAEEVTGYNLYGPVAYDLAHELVFDRWEGARPSAMRYEQRKTFRDGYTEALNQALNSTEDVFGEQVLRLPEGPTYENVKDYLTPLKLMGTSITESGVYYLPFGRPLNTAGYGPVALHVGDGSQLITPSSAGSKMTVYVGEEGQERYGFAEARLEQERLEGGYLPILINTYTDVSGVSYRQESFSDYTFASTELISFVKIAVKGKPSGTTRVKLNLLFSDKDLNLEGTVLKSGDKVRALVSPGAVLEGNSLFYQVDLKQETEQVFYMARLLHPSACATQAIDAAYYEAEKEELKTYWDQELAKGAVMEVPEERINQARKGLLIQNLYMGYLYSIGNSYQSWYQPEGNDAARILGEYGFLDHQKAIHQVLLSVPFRRYRTWEMGELLSHAAQYFHISRDTAYMRRHQEKLIAYMEDFGKQMAASEFGVLNMEAFSGDIAERLVYLHHQAVAWRGLRDMAHVIYTLGDTGTGNKYLALADSLRSRLLQGLHAGKTVLPDSSIFLPTELFTKQKPEPYPRITDTKYGSYWNLCFPYVAASGLLDQPLLSGYYQYLKNYGAFFLGMVRFNYYPVPVGDYRRDGLPGYKTTGVDNVYGLNLSRVMATLDDADRLVLSFYAKLAHGMTRDTYVSGEGDTLGPYPGEYYRTSYLSPSSFNNSWFLLMLRLMLIRESDGENGVPESLYLAGATPRAWLEHGKQVKVERAPTLFGELGYTVQSELDDGKIRATIQLPDRVHTAREVVLRLRTPDKRVIRKVKIDGRVHKAFNPDQETIDLTGKSGTIQVVVQY